MKKRKIETLVYTASFAFLGWLGYSYVASMLGVSLLNFFVMFTS